MWGAGDSGGGGGGGVYCPVPAKHTEITCPSQVSADGWDEQTSDGQRGDQQQQHHLPVCVSLGVYLRQSP